MTIVYSLFDNLGLADRLTKKSGYTKGTISFHTFPDDEICPKLHEEVNEEHVIFIAYLDRPTNKFLSLLLCSGLVRQYGAKSVELIVPYLPYMRQDKAFHAGEGITSLHFAKILSSAFDRITTIDPHLHRWHSLSQIYSIPSIVLHATNPIAEWLKKNTSQSLLIGPDKESAQWVQAIANSINAPYIILEKVRKNDFNVEITFPDLEQYLHHEIILIDDIISTANTMLKTIDLLKTRYQITPTCIGVHGLFSSKAYEKLKSAGIKKIITCNTIRHETNQIDINSLIIQSLLES